jgi:hypothetical protein
LSGKISFSLHPSTLLPPSTSSTSKLPQFSPPPLSFTFFVTVINIEVAAVLTATFVVVPAWQSLHLLYHRHQHRRRSLFTPPSLSFHRRSGMALTTNVALKKNKTITNFAFRHLL